MGPRYIRMDVNTTYLRRFPPRPARDTYIPGLGFEDEVAIFAREHRQMFVRVTRGTCGGGAPSVSRFYFGRSIVKVMGHRKDGSPIYLRARIFTYT